MNEYCVAYSYSMSYWYRNISTKEKGMYLMKMDHTILPSFKNDFQHYIFIRRRWIQLNFLNAFWFNKLIALFLRWITWWHLATPSKQTLVFINMWQNVLILKLAYAASCNIWWYLSWRIHLFVRSYLRIDIAICCIMRITVTVSTLELNGYIYLLFLTCIFLFDL